MIQGVHVFLSFDDRTNPTDNTPFLTFVHLLKKNVFVVTELLQVWSQKMVTIYQ
jgi:hypothetical protein